MGVRSAGRPDPFDSDRLRSGLRRKALGGAGATVASQVVIYAIQMVGTVVLARLLTPGDFGLVAMVTAFSLLLQNFGMRGFTEATIQAETVNRRDMSTLFWIQIALSVVLMVLFIALAPVLAWFYGEPRLIGITVAIAVSFLFVALATQHLALLSRNMQFYRVAGNEVIAAVLAQAAAILMALQGLEYWSLVGRRVIPLAAMAAGAWILCRWMPGIPAYTAAIKSMLGFGMNTYGNFVTSYLSRNLDKILIGWRQGAQPLGHYERAYYLFVMPVNQLSYPLTNVAVASLSRVRDDRSRYRMRYLESLSMLALVGMPASAVLTLTGRDLLVLLLGPQWQLAGEIFTIFGPCIGMTLVYGTHGWLHLSLGRADRWFRWGIVELVVTLACFAVGLSFGVIGVAAAYTVSFYVLIGPGLWYAGRPAGFTLRELLSPLWTHTLSAAAAGVASGYILHSIAATAALYGASNAVLRILAASALCLILHFLILASLPGGKRSMADFLRFVREILGHMSPGKNRSGAES